MVQLHCQSTDMWHDTGQHLQAITLDDRRAQCVADRNANRGRALSIDTDKQHGPVPLRAARAAQPLCSPRETYAHQTYAEELPDAEAAVLLLGINFQRRRNLAYLVNPSP